MRLNWGKRLIIFLSVILIICSLAFVLVKANAKSPAFIPVETDDVLNNPYIGWAPWANGGPYPQPHSLAYINVSWAELEPEKGKYDFDSLEKNNKFSYWRSRNVKIIFRLNMDYPDSKPHMDIPKWLYDEINGDGIKYDIPYGKGFSPNYSNPKLIFYHEKLINALAERYNNDDIILIIALGSIGHWGEFHTWKGNNFTIPFPGLVITDQYVSHYLKAFKNKFLVMRRPFQIAKDNKMGLYNDSFGDPNHTYNLFLDYINYGYRDIFTGEMQPEMPDFWMAAPSGGEFARFPGLEFFRDDKIKQTLQQVKDSHTSWLGPSSPVYQQQGGQLQKNFDQVLKTMGYRFVLKAVEHPVCISPGKNLTIDMMWENKGSAPFYYNWPLELSLSDSDGNIIVKATSDTDVRTWKPGATRLLQNFKIPDTVKGGKYSLCVAIIDPSTSKPGIQLAQEGRRPDGRYELDNVYMIRISIFPFFWDFLT